MLANPKRCPECKGEGRYEGEQGGDFPHQWIVEANESLKPDCPRCHGSGVVCGKCGKAEGECGCGMEGEKRQGVGGA